VWIYLAEYFSGTVTVPEWGTLGIECHEKTVIEVTRATYGNIDDYNKDVTKKLEEFCKGKNSCDVPANNREFGDPVPGAQKYLEVDYFCTPTIAGDQQDDISKSFFLFLPLILNNNKHNQHIYIYYIEVRCALCPLWLTVQGKPITFLNLQ
jgi:hypothetical protein